MNTFDPITHTFKINGVPVPSVTQALKAANIIDDRFYTDEARERGIAVHAACHYLDEECLDWETVAPEIVPYVEAYQRFKDESGFVPALIEEPVFNAQYFYGGILDRTGLLNGQAVLLDLKSGDPEPWANLQTAGYWGCLAQKHARYTLRLYPEGKYKLSNVHADPNDFRVFLSAVSIAHWKRNTGGESYDRSSPEISRVA